MIHFDSGFAIEQFPELLKAVPTTLFIAVMSMILGMLCGSLLAFCRIYKVPVLQKLAVVYVSFIRGTPILVQMYVIYFSLPELMILLNNRFGWQMPVNDISPLFYAILAFTINSTAYQSEVIRSGVNAIDSGQMEAALAVGMTTFQGIRRIILPQALLVALPNFGNIFINLIKATSLAFAVKAIEIMAVAKINASYDYRYLEMYVDAAIIYWVICAFFEKLFRVLEKRLSRHEKAQTI